MCSNSSVQDDKLQASSSSSTIHTGEGDERQHPSIELSSSLVMQHHGIISIIQHPNMLAERHQLESQQHKTVTPSPHTGQFTFSNVNIDTPSPQPVIDTTITSTTFNPHNVPTSTIPHEKIPKMNTLSPSQEQQLHSTRTTYLDILPHQQRQPTMLSIQPSTVHDQNPQQQTNPGSCEQHYHASGNVSPLRPYSNIISEVVVSSPIGLGSKTRENPLNVTMNKEVVDAVSCSPKKINLKHVKELWEGSSAGRISDTPIIKKRPATKYRASNKEDIIIQPPNGKKTKDEPIAHDINNNTSHQNIDTFPQLVSSVPQYTGGYDNFGHDDISAVAKGTSPATATASNLTSASEFEGIVVSTGSSDKTVSRSPLKLTSKCRPPDGSSAHAIGTVITPAKKVKNTTSICPTTEKWTQSTPASSAITSSNGNLLKQDIFTNREEVPLSSYTHEMLSLSTTDATASSTMATTATSTTANSITTPQEQGRHQSQRRNKRKEENNYRSIIWNYYAPAEAVDNCPDTELDLSLLPAHRRPK